MEVLKAGLFTSIQDLGRTGYQKYGVIVSGVMDAFSLRIANLLVGNPEPEAVMEITMVGPQLKVEKNTMIAITGADLSPMIAGERVPMWRPVYITQDTILQFGACKTGCRTYLAVAGGYHIKAVMGSQSTYLRAGIGGFSGRALSNGDVLQVSPVKDQQRPFIKKLQKNNQTKNFVSSLWFVPEPLGLASSNNIVIRVTRGNEFSLFDAASQKKFFGNSFQITTQSDRMGYRLSGDALTLENPTEMLSEAVTFGTIQIPPDGQPIILLADCQTTGGYPKIAQVARVDLTILAQSNPGQLIHFSEISLQEAEDLYMKREIYLQEIKRSIALYVN